MSIQVADKPTQDSIKSTVESSQTTLGTVKNTTDTVKTTTDTINGKADSILAELKGQRPKRYGFRVKESEADSSARVEYLFDAVGLTPAHMDFDNGSFNYGSWADAWFVRDNKPYMVKSSGVVDYMLDPNDYTKNGVTGAASDVANTSYDGNAMSAIPLCWVKRYKENGYRYVIFCEEQYDESYHAYAHTRPNGSISPFAYFPMFEGSTVSTKLRSLSGQAPMNTQTASTELTQAEANGAAWTILPWMAWELVMDLCTLIGKSTNHKAVFGQGHTTGGSSAADLHTTGALKDKGQFYGTSDGATGDVKVFHIENVMWGDRWERIIGMLYINGVYNAKPTPEGSGWNFTGSGYSAVCEGVHAAAAGGGWFKGGMETEFGLFPNDAGGADGYYDAAYHYYNPGIVSVPLVGGNCHDGSCCGRSVYVIYAASLASWDLGASLFLKNPS